jgi:hypothetical protein
MDWRVALLAVSALVSRAFADDNSLAASVVRLWNQPKPLMPEGPLKDLTHE